MKLFDILEIADTHATYEEIIQRENHWKTVLKTRDLSPKHELDSGYELKLTL